MRGDELSADCAFQILTKPGVRASGFSFEARLVRHTKRPATAEDLDLLQRLYAASRERDIGAMPLPPDVKARLIAQQFQIRQREYAERYPQARDEIILLEGEPAGRVLMDRSGEVWVLVDIILFAPYRGQGLGALVIGEVIEAAKDAGRTLDLHVEPHNPALRLYERLGFEAVEHTPTHIRMQLRPRGA